MVNTILTIGTVVRLFHLDCDVMIIGRYPIVQKNGQEGYFEYSGCIYPDGFYGKDFFLFNQEDIAYILAYGYCSDKEIELLGEMKVNQRALLDLHRFSIAEWKNMGA